MIIAIDGPAGSGKSTTANAVARELGFSYVDTGAMYRAVALAFVNQHAEPNDETAHNILRKCSIDVAFDGECMHIQLDGVDVSDEVRTEEVGKMASRVSALGAVRKHMIAFQRVLARQLEEKEGGVVVEGRDIGTVVLPNADVKIFMTASAEQRARRRYGELERNGAVSSYERVLGDIVARDASDRSRVLSPLLPAQDAHQVDTTDMTLAEQTAYIVDLIRRREGTTQFNENDALAPSGRTQSKKA